MLLKSSYRTIISTISIISSVPDPERFDTDPQIRTTGLRIGIRNLPLPTKISFLQSFLLIIYYRYGTFTSDFNDVKLVRSYKTLGNQGFKQKKISLLMEGS
jgi:hypothetical protein